MDIVFSRVRLFDGSAFAGGLRDLGVERGRVAAIAADGSVEGRETIEGGTLFPGFVDAHVHLSLSNARAVARGGVTAVLDLGAPLGSAFDSHPPLRVRASGPLLTAPGGYPTRSWGANGFGLEIGDAAAAREAVASLADRGAAMVKVAIEPAEPPALSAEMVEAVVAAAHARGLRVAAHALGVAPVRAAEHAGVDVLAHTPIERLPDRVVHALAERGTTVVSTVRAFGSSRATRDNLASLAAAGCAIVYGTDLGNGAIRPGIDVRELAEIAGALGGEERALAAATAASGGLCGNAGTILAGGRADLVWVRRYERLGDLAGANRVWIGGAEIS